MTSSRAGWGDDRGRFAIILLVALALRVAWRAGSGPQAFWTDGYTFFFDLAERLAAGQGYGLADGVPSAFRVPLYPLVLAGLTGGERAFWPVLVFQALVSTCTVACAALLAREWFGVRAGLVAGALCAVYPYYVIHDTSLAETGLFTFLTALGVLLLVRARATMSARGSWAIAGVAGVALGLAILTRATLAPFVPLAAAWLALMPVSGGTRRRGMLAGAALLAGCGLTLSPWLAYSHAVTGRAGLGTEFGAALYAAQHRLTFSHYPDRSIDRSREEVFASLDKAERAERARLGRDEAAISDWYQRKAIAAMAAHPARTLGYGLRKLAAAFGPLPSPRKSALGNAAHALSYGPVALLALAGAWRTRRRWRELLPLAALFAIFAAITAVLWGHTNHRSVLDVYLIVLAAPVLTALVPRWKDWPSPSDARS